MDGADGLSTICNHKMPGCIGRPSVLCFEAWEYLQGNSRRFDRRKPSIKVDKNPDAYRWAPAGTRQIGELRRATFFNSLLQIITHIGILRDAVLASDRPADPISKKLADVFKQVWDRTMIRGTPVNPGSVMDDVVRASQGSFNPRNLCDIGTAMTLLVSNLQHSYPALPRQNLIHQVVLSRVEDRATLQNELNRSWGSRAPSEIFTVTSEEGIVLKYNDATTGAPFQMAVGGAQYVLVGIVYLKHLVYAVAYKHPDNGFWYQSNTNFASEYSFFSRSRAAHALVFQRVRGPMPNMARQPDTTHQDYWSLLSQLSTRPIGGLRDPGIGNAILYLLTHSGHIREALQGF